jgi:hypothetical protein
MTIVKIVIVRKIMNTMILSFEMMKKEVIKVVMKISIMTTTMMMKRIYQKNRD